MNGTAQDNHSDKTAKDRQHKGERFPQSKATEDQVLAIRSLYARGEMNQRQLSEIFGINQSVVSRIISRKIWKHVA